MSYYQTPGYYQEMLADIVGKDPYDGRWPDAWLVEQARMVLAHDGWSLEDETILALLREVMAP